MNILLIQLKRIGDLILTTPAIAAVREKFWAAKISLVVSAGTQELLPAITGVDRAFVAHGRIRDAVDWFQVARCRFAYCVDFTHNDRSAFLTMLSNARKRVTSSHAPLQSKVRALSYNEFVECSVRLNHTVDQHLALLEPLGIRDAARTLHLSLPSPAFQQADRIRAEHGIPDDYLVLHPGSARIEKFWEPERWSTLLEFAAGQGLACVVTGGTSPFEQEHIAQIKSHCRAPFVDLTGNLNLLALAALIQRARLLITVDSAPMHLAAATQTPQVVLFGPTNPLHWRPRFSPAVILQAGTPEPLTEFSPRQKRVPMNQISTEQVIDGMKALLAHPRAASV